MFKVKYQKAALFTTVMGVLDIAHFAADGNRSRLFVKISVIHGSTVWKLGWLICMLSRHPEMEILRWSSECGCGTARMQLYEESHSQSTDALAVVPDGSNNS